METWTIKGGATVTTYLEDCDNNACEVVEYGYRGKQLYILFEFEGDYNLWSLDVIPASMQFEDVINCIGEYIYQASCICGCPEDEINGQFQEFEKFAIGEINEDPGRLEPFKEFFEKHEICLVDGITITESYKKQQIKGELS